MICRERWTRDIHEIAKGVRQNTIQDKACWLAACRECHDDLENLAKWPIDRQMAVCQKWNPDYDRVTINLLRGRSPEAITKEDVDKWKI